MLLTKLPQHTPHKSDVWGLDPLERRACAETLTSLIKGMTKSYVIGLYGHWGSGKTVFLQQLELELEAIKVPVVRVDAWRSDFLSDPLVALVDAINRRQAQEAAVTGAALARSGDELLEASLTMALPLAEIGSAASAVATPGWAAAGAALKGVITMAKEIVTKRVEASNDLREGIKKARDFLTKRDRESPMGPVIKPLVVIIDELDRCRPDYAVRMLERIKHFFDIHGVVFVIASDGKNLPSAVRSQYGPGVNGEEYLRKFFDYEYMLPEPTAQQFVAILFESFGWRNIVPEGNMLYDQGFGSRNAIDEFLSGIRVRDRRFDYSDAFGAFPEMAAWLGLKLRDQAQAFTLVDVYLRTRGEQEVAFPHLAVFLACLRFGREEKYRAIIRNPVVENILKEMDEGWSSNGHGGVVQNLVALLSSWGPEQQRDAKRVVENAISYGGLGEGENLHNLARLVNFRRLDLSTVVGSFARLAPI
ncbi:P-loop NTPase fold protein [Stenotrophomonas sp. TWI1151]|jgi:hypothetical protein|uniref:KAP family P-loop NTPase fold protein n=1 Tax=Stenotrophomonas sp. TWI1151 TaxID=3136798 RepID=UPI003207A8BD